jgi:hypothetical protein
MKDGALAQICDRKRLAREKRKKKRCRRTENDLLVHLRRRLFQRPNRKQYRRTMTGFRPFQSANRLATRLPPSAPNKAEVTRKLSSPMVSGRPPSEEPITTRAPETTPVSKPCETEGG